MLTLILLVVLGGGLGILAVSMAEGKPATNDPESRRARVPEAVATTIEAPEPEPEPPTDPEPEPEPVPVPHQVEESAHLEPVPRSTSRRAPRDVPASQTAIEGPFADLVRPSLPRRLVSLVTLVVVVVIVGVGIAALLGAIVGGAAEIVGNAIG